jgi:hypothetical protein
MMPQRAQRPGPDVRRTDSRWLAIGALVFALASGGIFAARELYRATAPHPHIEQLLRRTKYYANSLLRQGRLKRK